MSGRPPAELWRDPPPPALDPAATEVVLALADDELLAGHRHSEWLGLSPFLEEDLALASIAQDELGHARALYALVWPDIADHERDALVVRRPPGAFRSAWLCEVAPEPWERALMRHLLYDLAEEHRWQQVTESSVRGLGGLAAKALAEERYHRRHAVDLVVRLGHGTEEARQRLQTALDELWPLALALFEPLEGERDAVEYRVTAAEAHDLVPSFRGAAVEVIETAGLAAPTEPSPLPVTGARTGTRHPDFASAHEQLLTVFGYDPDARW